VRTEKEMAETNEKYENMKMEYDLCKEKIADMRVKLENLTKNSKLSEYETEINKMKTEFENNVKKKDIELKDLKESLDKNTILVERLRNMEKALKRELESKDDELRSRQRMINEIQEENDKITDDNMALKKENFQLQSRVEFLEKEYRDKSDNEKMIRMNELKQLREKEKKYLKLIQEMKETLKKKQRVIENKKNMNLMLVDLAKIKKGEVQCLETMQYTSSDKLKETLLKIRDNERELLSRYYYFFLTFIDLERFPVTLIILIRKKSKMINLITKVFNSFI
jgi:chromosome segregation ATPase